MKSSMKVIISLVLLASTLSFSQARATDENFDLQIDNEEAIANSDAEVQDAAQTRELLAQEQQRHHEEALRLKEEIRVARINEESARKERLQNEREIARLQKETASANAELREAKKIENKSQQKLKMAQAYASRTQRSRDAIVKKKEAAVARMTERHQQAQQMADKAKQAWADYKTAQAQYRQALQHEKAQKVALEKKKALLKKKMGEIHLKTNKLKAMTKKLEQNRAG
jgi:hypothetical protein